MHLHVQVLPNNKKAREKPANKLLMYPRLLGLDFRDFTFYVEDGNGTFPIVFPIVVEYNSLEAPARAGALYVHCALCADRSLNIVLMCFRTIKSLKSLCKP